MHNNLIGYKVLFYFNENGRKKSRLKLPAMAKGSRNQLGYACIKEMKKKEKRKIRSETLSFRIFYRPVQFFFSDAE